MSFLLLWLALGIPAEEFVIQRFGVEVDESTLQRYEVLGDFILFSVTGIDARELEIVLGGHEITENVDITFTEQGALLHVPTAEAGQGWKELVFLAQNGFRVVHFVRINPTGITVREEGRFTIEN